jgi:hypothetical protein
MRAAMLEPNRDAAFHMLLLYPLSVTVCSSLEI